MVGTKTLAVFLSVVLVVGLMPGLVAWGDTGMETAASLEETAATAAVEPITSEVQSEPLASAGSPAGPAVEAADNPSTLEEADVAADAASSDQSKLPAEQAGNEGALNGEGETLQEGEALDNDQVIPVDQGEEASEEEDAIPASDLDEDAAAAPAAKKSAKKAASVLQSGMTAQAGSYSITFTRGSSSSITSNKASGAATGDTITLIFVNQAIVSRTFYYDLYGDGALLHKKNENVYNVPKQSTYSVDISVPTGYKYDRASLGGNGMHLEIYFTKLPSYKLTYNYNNKPTSTISSATGYVGYPVSIKKTPTSRSGFTFSGWNTRADGSGTHYDNDSQATFWGDTTLYAEWTRTATFQPGTYGSSNVSNATVYYDNNGTGYINGTSATSFTVKLSGSGEWKPLGWSTSGSGQTPQQADAFSLTGSTLTGTSKTFYGILEREVSVTYDPNGADPGFDNVPATQKLTQKTYGSRSAVTTSSVTLQDAPADLEKDGYEFDGWDIDETTYQPFDTYSWETGSSNAAVTAKARWIVSTLVPNNMTVSLADWTYGDPPNSPVATADYGAGSAEYAYSTSKSGPFSTTVPTDAGTYWVRAVVAKDKQAGFKRGEAVASFKILPKEADLDWSNTSFTYDGARHVPTAAVRASSLVGSDSCSVTVSGEQTDAGSYTANATALSNPNYKLPANPSCAFTIAKVPLTVTAKDYAITYGDAPAGNGVTYSGFIAGDSEATAVTGSPSYTFSYAQYGDVGTYAITLGGLSSTNYAITYADGSLTVEPLEANFVWSSPNSFDYNGGQQSWPAPAVGNAVNGDDVSAVWASSTPDDADAHEATKIATYAPVVGSLVGTKAGNYKLPSAVASKTGSWSIVKPATNSMTVSMAGWVYGHYSATTNAPKVTADFGLGTETFTYWTDPTCTSNQVTGVDLDGNGVPKNAGTYYVKAVIPGTANYPDASAISSFTILKANITVTADDKQSQVNQSKVALTYTVTGDFQTSDASDLANYVEATETTGQAVDTSTVNRYPIKAQYKSGYAAHPNYTIWFTDGTYTVTRGTATVVATGWTGPYDGTDTGKHITVTVTAPGATDIKVYYSDKSFDQIVNQVDLTTLQTATDVSQSNSVWVAAWNSVTASLDAAEKAKTCSQTAADYSYKEVGNHEVYFLVLSQQAKPDVITGSRLVKINPAQLTVTANDNTIAYGDAPTHKGVTYAGFVNGEDENTLGLITGTLAYDYGTYTAASSVGNYPITPSGISSAKYTIIFVPGTLTVSKKQLSLVWPQPNSFTYNGSAQTYGPPTLTGVLSQDAGNVGVTVAAGTNTATDVGSYTALATGLGGSAAGNYELPTTGLQGPWSITGATLTVTANDHAITYGDAPSGNGVTYSGWLGSDNENTPGIISGALTYAFDYNQYDPVGAYKITPGGISSPNYTVVFADGKLAVNPREVSFAWPMPDRLPWTGSRITYGTPTLGNIVNNDDVQVDAYTGNEETDGGTYTATVGGLKGAAAGNYKLPSNPTHQWTIYDAPNNLSVDLDDWYYGDPAKTPTVSATAGANNVTLEYSLSDSSTGPWYATPPTDAGDYYVRATIPATSYYAAADATDPFTIHPRVVGLNWSNTAFVYDGSSHIPTATLTGLIGSDVCTVTVKGDRVDAGLHTATATKLSNANYALPQPATCLFTIAAAALTITANDNTITYGDAPSGNGVTYSGFAPGEDENTPGLLSGTLTYSFDYNQYDPVGSSYKITPGGLSSTDYAITFVPGKLTVDPREVTLTWSTPDTFTYDGVQKSWPVPTVGNLVNGDAVTAVWASSTAGAANAHEATNAGIYQPAVGSLAGANAGNYKLPSSVLGKWEIQQPSANTMTVSVAGWTYGKYNSSVNKPVVTATCGLGTEVLTYYTDASLTTPVAASEIDPTDKVPTNAGKYWVKAEIAATANYPAASASCSFEISKANITVTADDQTSVRSTTGSLISPTYQITGDLVATDKTDLDNNYIEAENDPNAKIDNVGSYPITVGWKSGVTSHPNYEITFVNGTYAVTRAISKVAAKGYTGVYDGVADTEHISVSVTTTNGAANDIHVYYSDQDFKTTIGLSSSEIADLGKTDASDSGFVAAFNKLEAATSTRYTEDPKTFTYRNAGTYKVYFVVVSKDTTPDVIFGSSDVVINKAPLTVTAKNHSIMVGDDEANDGVTFTGFVNSETEAALRAIAPTPELSGTLAYAYGTYKKTSPMGVYPIVPSGLTATNYAITYVPGTLTVNARKVTLDWKTPDSFVYTGSEQEYEVPDINGLLAGDNVSVVMTSGTNKATDAGSYTATVASLTGSDAYKYVFDSTAQLSHPWSITPASLTITAKDNTITYGDAPAANGVEYTGLLTTHGAAKLTGSLTYAYGYTQCGDVGDYPGAITPGGLASPNYTITYIPGKLTVKQRALTLTWPSPDQFTYSGSEFTYGEPTLGNIVNSDNVKIDEYSGNKGTNAGAYTAKVESLKGSKAHNYTVPAAMSHPWNIQGAANSAFLTMSDWTYGDTPSTPSLSADFGAGTAVFAYFTNAALTEPVSATDLDANGDPFVAGSYWVKATIPAGAGYDGAEASDSFTINRRPLTVKALGQVVRVGESVSSSVDQVTATNLATGDGLSGVTITGTSTAKRTLGGTVTPSAAIVETASGRDITASYDITYEPADLYVVGGHSKDNGKVIYVMFEDIWITVAKAAELLADPDVDNLLIGMAGAQAHEIATGNPLPVEVADKSALVAAVGVYPVTFKTNPEVPIRVHVMDSSTTDPDTGVTVYANDTEPDPDVLAKAKAGDRDAIESLIQLAKAVGIDQDGEEVPVTDMDLSSVDLTVPGTYPVTYFTADGASGKANVMFSELPKGDDEDGDGSDEDGKDDDGKDADAADDSSDKDAGTDGNGRAGAKSKAKKASWVRPASASKLPATGDTLGPVYGILCVSMLVAATAGSVARRRMSQGEAAKRNNLRKR